MRKFYPQKIRYKKSDTYVIHHSYAGTFIPAHIYGLIFPLWLGDTEEKCWVWFMGGSNGKKKKKRKTESAPLLQFMIEDFLGLASKLHYHGLCWGLFFNCSTVQFLFLLTYPSLNSLCVYFFWNHSSIKQLVYRSSTWSLFPGNQETTLCINIIMMY